MAISAYCITRLLDSKAVADSDVYWFRINLDLRVLGIARKNILKALHDFYKVDDNSGTSTLGFRYFNLRPLCNSDSISSPDITLVRIPN